MSSEKKKRKLKNSYCVPSTLKNKLPHKCKRLLFYTSSQRQKEKQEVKENEEINEENVVQYEVKSMTVFLY